MDGQALTLHHTILVPYVPADDFAFCGIYEVRRLREALNAYANRRRRLTSYATRAETGRPIRVLLNEGSRLVRISVPP